MNGNHRDAAIIRVLVADSSRIHTRLLADALQSKDGLLVVPCEPTAADLLSAAKLQPFDVLVISANLDESAERGFEVLRELRALRPGIRAVLLLDSSKDEMVLKAFRAGARGVFSKNDPIDLLGKCVRCVHEGQIWADSRYLGIAMEALANTPSVRALSAEGLSLLSEREAQVVRCLAEGLTNREIADRLDLSQHTVKNYLFRVFEKLGVSSRVELLSMTLSQSSPDCARIRKDVYNNAGYSRDEADLLRKSAEAGLPAAQLALAQLCLDESSGPDLVEACKWYIVATEGALHARESVTRMMTPRQIEEANRRASFWLSEHRRTAAGIASKPVRSVAAAASAAPMRKSGD
jgi:DNA-binding NarL/FixJ family response regulator